MFQINKRKKFKNCEIDILEMFKAAHWKDTERHINRYVKILERLIKINFERNYAINIECQTLRKQQNV